MRSYRLWPLVFVLGACSTHHSVTKSISESSSRLSDEVEEVRLASASPPRDSVSRRPAVRRRAPASSPVSEEVVVAAPSPPKVRARLEVWAGDDEMAEEGTKDAPAVGALSSGVPTASGPRPGPAIKTPKARPRRARARAPTGPQVKAGAADDNIQFGAFLRFLNDHQGLGLAHDVSDRVVVRVVDSRERPVAGAQVTVRLNDRVALRRTTYADGRALIHRSESSLLSDQGARIEVGYDGQRVSTGLSHRHELTMRLNQVRKEVDRVPLDVAFVLDTTGSMGDEIDRLKSTLDVIHFQITHLSPRPDVRFGMVLYRDLGDAYRTRVIPFTPDVAAFARALDGVAAGGGGDDPEDMQAGLHAAMTQLDWRDTGVKLGFLIGDAPPHLDYGQSYTYVNAMQDAARRGIKFATIGASGLNQAGEVVWRQLAQYTMGPFVFLTYGETGNAEGSPGSVSHHVGSNWVAQDLDAIVVRLVKMEVAHWSSRGAPRVQDYFEAVRHDFVPPGDVLDDLFRQSVKQLVDYAVEPIAPRTPTVILPAASSLRMNAVASRLRDRLSVELAHAPPFQLIEQKGKQNLLETLADQLSHHYDESRATEVGKWVPAQLAVLSQVKPHKDGPMEMLVKLVRLETGEILSLSLLKIDPALMM